GRWRSESARRRASSGPGPECAGSSQNAWHPRFPRSSRFQVMVVDELLKRFPDHRRGMGAAVAAPFHDRRDDELRLADGRCITDEPRIIIALPRLPVHRRAVGLQTRRLVRIKNRVGIIDRVALIVEERADGLGGAGFSGDAKRKIAEDAFAGPFGSAA